MTLLLAAALTGCARYEYVLLEPADVAQPLPDGGKLDVPIEPLEYHFADLGERLYVRVRNPTDDTLAIAGDRSFVVDPRGESRRLGEGIIAPHSFIEFALPPATRVYRAYPAVGFGVGFGFSRGYRRGYYPYGPYPYDPFYGPPYRYGPDQVYKWAWQTGEVRLHLSYLRGDQRIDHEFLILRRRTR